MRHSVRKFAWGALAAMAFTFVTPSTPASADAGDTVHGGCEFLTYREQAATSGVNKGAIEVSAALQNSAGIPDSGASVRCKIQVNGIDAPGTEIDVDADTAGLVQGQAQIVFDDQGGTLPSALCEEDNWSDGDSSGWVCQGSSQFQIPPQAVIDAVNSVTATTLDPTVCPVFQELHDLTGGGVLGVVRIGADGDLYLAQPVGVGYDKVYDCPPYGSVSVLVVDEATVTFALPSA